MYKEAALHFDPAIVEAFLCIEKHFQIIASNYQDQQQIKEQHVSEEAHSLQQETASSTNPDLDEEVATIFESNTDIETEEDHNIPTVIKFDQLKRSLSTPIHVEEELQAIKL